MRYCFYHKLFHIFDHYIWYKNNQPAERVNCVQWELNKPNITMASKRTRTLFYCHVCTQYNLPHSIIARTEINFKSSAARLWEKFDEQEDDERNKNDENDENDEYDDDAAIDENDNDTII